MFDPHNVFFHIFSTLCDLITWRGTDMNKNHEKIMKNGRETEGQKIGTNRSDELADGTNKIRTAVVDLPYKCMSGYDGWVHIHLHMTCQSCMREVPVIMCVWQWLSRFFWFQCAGVVDEGVCIDVALSFTTSHDHTHWSNWWWGVRVVMCVSLCCWHWTWMCEKRERDRRIKNTIK